MDLLITYSILNVSVEIYNGLIRHIPEQYHVLNDILKKSTFRNQRSTVPATVTLQNDFFEPLKGYPVVIYLVPFQRLIKAPVIGPDLCITDDRMVIFKMSFCFYLRFQRRILFDSGLIVFHTHISAPGKFYRRIVAFFKDFMVRTLL